MRDDDIAVRPYEEWDRAEVVDLMVAVWSEEPWDTIDREEAGEELDSCLGEDGRMLVAVCDGEIIGFCGGYPLSEREHLPEEGYAEEYPDGFYVRSLGVAQEVRGVGIGRRLMAALEDVVDAPTIHLKTEPGSPAYGFYRHLGYTDTGLAGRKGRHWFVRSREG